MVLIGLGFFALGRRTRQRVDIVMAPLAEED